MLAFISLSSLCYELFMRQLSHCSHRHVNTTFWSLTEDFINEYGSKFLDNKSFIVDWLISKENINDRTYIPSGKVCDRANQEACEFDSFWKIPSLKPRLRRLGTRTLCFDYKGFVVFQKQYKISRGIPIYREIHCCVN